MVTVSGVEAQEGGQAGVPAPSQEGTEGGESTCTSLSRAITKACISDSRISLTITTHSLVAVVAEGHLECSIWIQRHAGTKGCILVANLTNRRSGPELDGWLLTLLLFLVAASSHLSECCLLTALAADWSGAGHRRKLRGKQPHGGCARELLVIELWVPHRQEGGRGPFVMITILWCRARVLLVLLSLWYLASQHTVSTSCMKEH